MTRGTISKTVESAEYDFIRDKAQAETIELLAKTLIEVRKSISSNASQEVIDRIDIALSKSGFKQS